MKEFRTLLQQFWIPREGNQELYYQIRKKLPEIKPRLKDQFGWRLIENEQVIKLEKTPAHAQPFMGITEFTDCLDYCLLCGLLIYLEDRDATGQFLLSELTNGLKLLMAAADIELNWEQYAHRKSLVRVMTYAEKMHLVRIYETLGGSFADSMSSEVLYESTGLSRWFAIHHPYDVSGCHTAEDFEAALAGQQDQDRGILRTQRVYQQLALSPAAYWVTADDPLFTYVKNQRSWIQRYLDHTLEGELEIHKNGAFFLLREDNSCGETFPNRQIMSDIVLAFCSEIRQMEQTSQLQRQPNDFLLLTREQLEDAFHRCHRRWSSAWGKQKNELSQQALLTQVCKYMEDWQLLQRSEPDGTFTVLPAAAMWVGTYPKDFTGEEVTK